MIHYPDSCFRRATRLVIAMSFAAWMPIQVLSAQEPVPSPNQPDPDRPEPRPEPPQPDEDAAAPTADAVRKVLESSTVVDTKTLEVEMRGAVVVLEGAVDSLRASRQVLELCLSVDGVVGIVDLSDIARHANDGSLADRVRDALHKALQGEPDTDSASWTVDDLPDDGIRIETSLTGQAAARLADIAESVPGVRSVELVAGANEGPPATDAEVQAQIERLLSRDVWLADSVLRVNVRSGIAHLSGTLDAADLLDRAVTLARVPGVTSVDSSALMILEKPDDPVLRRTLTPLADESITAYVERVLAADDRLAGHALEFDVDGGIVVLRGTVPSQLARAAAIQDVENTLGVRSVRSEVTIEA